MSSPCGSGFAGDKPYRNIKILHVKAKLTMNRLLGRGADLSADIVTVSQSTRFCRRRLLAVGKCPCLGELRQRHPFAGEGPRRPVEPLQPPRKTRQGNTDFELLPSHAGPLRRSHPSRPQTWTESGGGLLKRRSSRRPQPRAVDSGTEIRTTENGECSNVSHAKAIFLFNRQHLMPACNSKQRDYGCQYAVFEALVHGVVNSN
jgi:hypothetical protein